LKFGDRFYYENYDEKTGFTEEQLNSIRTVTMSRVLCGTLGIDFIQKYAFFTANQYWNPLKDCHDIPGIDLNLWKDNSYSSYNKA
jgi:hypothetical protein